MVRQINPYLYSIPVDLPGSPLKNLNSYVFKGKKRNLLVDTGFNRPECLASLKAGISELGLDMDKTDIFITHCHADHCGLAPEIASPAASVYMSAVDKAIVNQYTGQGEAYWEKLDQTYVREGFPEEEMAVARRLNPARRFIPSRNFASRDMADGDKIALDDFIFTCVSTPGHTPGHMCLYDEKARIMLTGDHVLFDITPNITVWEGLPDALAGYLASLRKIRDCPVDLALAAHRESRQDLAPRVDELLRHHQARLQDAWEIVRAHGRVNAYQAAARMKWNIRARGWDDFPLGQKRFAVGEALSHLNHLVYLGKLGKKPENGINYYTNKEIA
ncbi:MAG: MBL fold metallo-hydrolase [Desulfarculales bacterium]|nr:MBL fold metallo-hydrolase [Desulfarculales bacterium]